jgi:hypothetical protein
VNKANIVVCQGHPNDLQQNKTAKLKTKRVKKLPYLLLIHFADKSFTENRGVVQKLLDSAMNFN